MDFYCIIYRHNLPIEELRPKVIDEILKKLHAAGMPTDTHIFLSGHSMGVELHHNI